jgi:hypothetical protein
MSQVTYGTEIDLKLALFDVIEQQSLLQQQFAELEKKKNELVADLNHVRSLNLKEGEVGQARPKEAA